MQLLGPDGKPVDVPEADVPKTFLSGAAGFAPGTTVPMVGANGQIGHVPAEKAQEAFGSGARIASPEEIHRAELQAEYGTMGGMLEAGAAGTVRGATVGLSDPIAIAAARATGGEAAAEKTRRTLAGLKEANPLVSGVAEVGGALAPLLATGGAAAPIEEAEVASLLARGAPSGASKVAGLLGTGATDTGLAVAREAGTGSKVARILGAPSRAVVRVGEGAEGAARALVGADATSLTGRIAQGAVRLGARGAAENALYAGGQEMSEQSLGGDPELNGEKLLAAMGHGALFGAGIGGALGASGEIGREIFGRSRTALASLAETQAWRSISGRTAFQTAADRIPGGSEAVGRQLLDDGIVAAGDRVEDIAPKVAAAREAAGADIGAKLDAADSAGVSGPNIQAVRERAQEALHRLRAMPETNAGAIKRLEGLLNDLEGFAEKKTPFRAPKEKFEIGVAPNEYAAPRATKAFEITKKREPFVLNPDAGLEDAGTHGWRIGEGGPAAHLGEVESPIKIDMTRPGHIGDGVGIDSRMMEGADVGPGGIGVRKAYDVGIKPGAFTEEASRVAKPFRIGLAEEANTAAHLKARAAYDKGLHVTFREAQGWRSQLDELIKWNTNPMAPVSEATEAMKAVRNALENEIMSAGEAGSSTLGTKWREEYEAAKLKYRRLTVADQAAQDAAERMAGNRVVSPTDYLVGAAGLAGSLGAHGLVGGLHGLAMGAAHHVIRTRGNATAAVLLDKAASLGAVQRAITTVDRQIARGIAGLLREGTRAPAALRADPFAIAGKGEHPRDRHADAVRDAVRFPDHHGDAIERAVAPIADHAPNIANAFQRAAIRTTVALHDALPKSNARDPLTPQLSKPVFTDADRARYDTVRAIAHDPVGVTFHAMGKGMLTKEHVETFKKVAPSLYQQMATELNSGLATLKTPVEPYSRRMAIARFLGTSPERPEFASAMQATHKANTAPASPISAARAPVASAHQRQGLADRVRLGTSGGI